MTSSFPSSHKWDKRNCRCFEIQLSVVCTRVLLRTRDVEGCREVTVPHGRERFQRQTLILRVTVLRVSMVLSLYLHFIPRLGDKISVPLILELFTSPNGSQYVIKYSFRSGLASSEFHIPKVTGYGNNCTEKTCLCSILSFFPLNTVGSHTSRCRNHDLSGPMFRVKSVLNSVRSSGETRSQRTRYFTSTFVNGMFHYTST